MFMNMMRVDDNMRIRVIRDRDGKVSIFLGDLSHLRLSMDELAQLKYEIDATIMTAGMDYCSTHHVHGACDECEFDEKGYASVG